MDSDSGKKGLIQADVERSGAENDLPAKTGSGADALAFALDPSRSAVWF
jgi:hypothetical protein